MFLSNLRPVVDADRDALLDLWNGSARFDPLGSDLLHEKVWGDADYAPDLTLVADVDRRPIAFAMGVIRRDERSRRGYVKMLVVDATRRRSGIGRMLLAKVESRLRGRGINRVRVGESAPNYLTPGVDVRYTEGSRFFEKQGYESVGETCNMEVDLSRGDFDTGDRQRVLAAAGIVVCRARYEDQSAVAAFLQAHWPTWRQEVQTTFSRTPIGLHLAWQGPTVVGFSAFDGNNVGTGWFGPMGTAPNHRQMGIGGVLLRRCLHDLRAQGRTRAIIPWVGPVAFYRRHVGAEIARRFCRYQKTLA